MRRHVVIVLLALAVITTACGSDDSGQSTDGPPTDAAITADDDLTAAPEGYAECPSIDLSSGWPTTTVFLVENGDGCITGAAVTGSPAQQSFTGWDGRGGLFGTIIRIDEPGSITEISYTISPGGEVESTSETCASLDTTSIGPPSCATG